MPPDPFDRLGYLLKHVQLRYAERTSAAIAPLGIDTREFGALVCLGEPRPLSQAEVARLVGVDRTTMVALVDQLEAKDLVRRRPHEEDRRKNVVELTPAGREVVQQAGRRIDAAERTFLAALGAPEAEGLKRALRALVDPGYAGRSG